MHSRMILFVEAVTNLVIGFGVAVLTQVLVFSDAWIGSAGRQNVSIAGIFTMVSLMRGYVLSCVFQTMCQNRHLFSSS